MFFYYLHSVPGIKRRKITNKEQKDRNNNNINTAFEAEPAAKLVTNLPSGLFSNNNINYYYYNSFFFSLQVCGMERFEGLRCCGCWIR